jgi:hypothetical protein
VEDCFAVGYFAHPGLEAREYLLDGKRHQADQQVVRLEVPMVPLLEELVQLLAWSPEKLQHVRQYSMQASVALSLAVSGHKWRQVAPLSEPFQTSLLPTGFVASSQREQLVSLSSSKELVQVVLPM